MTNARITKLLADLAADGRLDLTGPSIADLRVQCDAIVGYWPGVSYRICPDPVGGKFVATVAAPVRVG